jgi:hypothetical protein
MEEYRKEKPRRFTPRRNVDKGKEIKTAWDRLCIVGMKHVARRGEMPVQAAEEERASRIPHNLSILRKLRLGSSVRLAGSPEQLPHF